LSKSCKRERVIKKMEKNMWRMKVKMNKKWDKLVKQYKIKKKIKIKKYCRIWKENYNMRKKCMMINIMNIK
jgi:hypothetical protein